LIAGRALNRDEVTRDASEPIHESDVDQTAYVAVGDLPTPLAESVLKLVALYEGIHS
jgi:hypothetical protein